ncbi:MAG TPA: Gfo/Idh/MocA family oxidoreductase [Geminicoccus sp.]|jgi:predicted dehydrogenase|uniref:Gfo/Idh/MocA family protein n=1 Tax=Geminicoccus sp. TaxID=2024832 RepID=UPI002E32CF5F|nr:Gfo/Idh/MocA family oxidoreductase [Geminicoccus sp.]HEX2524992.1 Gfo/Idh/MocA family oxidoreductase [Geminicoccus sp.]
MIVPADLRQEHPLPSNPRPIVIVGTGGIAADAHLPAYRKAGFPVAGLFDLDQEKARALAARFGVPRVFATMEEAVATPGCVVDVAAPPVAHHAILSRLPAGSVVLLQKPMGLDLEAATAIRNVCRERSLTAAVNFQLRFSAMMMGVADALRRGLLGRLIDVEVHLNLVTPWHLFPHLLANERVEIVSHSIHYLDMIRSVAGNPRSVFARSCGHPSTRLAQTRTSAILDYGDDDRRVTLSINHHHDFGRRFQDASFRFEGDQGAAMVKLGLLLDYPAGEPDELWLARKGGPWEQVTLCGSWFPDAFIGVMANLQRFAAGEDQVLATSVEDAWHTMALVESCYRSLAMPGIAVPDA